MDETGQHTAYRGVVDNLQPHQNLAEAAQQLRIPGAPPWQFHPGDRQLPDRLQGQENGVRLPVPELEKVDPTGQKPETPNGELVRLVPFLRIPAVQTQGAKFEQPQREQVKIWRGILSRHHRGWPPVLRSFATEQ